MSMLGKMLGFGRNEHYDRGIRLFDQGIYEEAIRSFARAREPHKGRKDELTERLATFYTAEACANLGHLAMKSGQWEQAQTRFRAALEINPQYADLHFNLALSLRAGQQTEDALAELETALDINPRFAKAHLVRGLLDYELGRHEQAVNALYRALEFEPGFRTETFCKALEYHEAGDTLAALQAFEQVSHTQIDDIQFHFKLGDDLFRRGLYEDCIAEYQKALMLNPNYADVRNHLGMAYHAKGMLNDAVAEFQYAISVNPHFVTAMLNLAALHSERGHHGSARTMYAEVLKIEPDNPVALNAIEEQGAVYVEERIAA